jgi:hypothetical protein
VVRTGWPPHLSPAVLIHTSPPSPRVSRDDTHSVEAITVITTEWQLSDNATPSDNAAATGQQLSSDCALDDSERFARGIVNSFSLTSAVCTYSAHDAEQSPSTNRIRTT